MTVEALPEAAPETAVQQPRTEFDQAVERSQAFIDQNSYLIGALVGLRGLNVRVGKGFATNFADGEVTVDPRFFLEQGFRPEWCTYGLMHEFAAHLREMVTEPKLTHEKEAFFNSGAAEALFLNILDDVSGNRRVHRILPVMEQIGSEIYSEKLFPVDDFTNKSRHVQLLYSIIRTAMIPGSQSIVAPEVTEALESLRSIGRRQQDVIEYATNPRFAADKRWDATMNHIWPVYEELLERDREDAENAGSNQSQAGPEGDAAGGEPSEQSGQESQPGGEAGEAGGAGSSDDNQKPEDQAGGSGEGEAETEAGDDASSDGEGQGNTGNQEDADGSGQGSGNGAGGENSDKNFPGKGEQFGDDYADYWQNHSEPFGEEAHEEIEKQLDEHRAQAAQEAQEKRAKQHGPRSRPQPTIRKQSAREILERAAGAKFDQILDYRQELAQYWPAVERMEEFYRELIGERLTLIRKLESQHEDGIILDPNLLAEAHIQIASGNADPQVFMRYKSSVEKALASGGVDIDLIIDRSTSMAESANLSSSMNDGSKAVLAAITAMIFCEGFDVCQQSILETEAAEGVKLGLDIRTQVSVFDSNWAIVKPLSDDLSEKDRMRVNAAVKSTKGSTADFLPLEGLKARIELEGQQPGDLDKRQKIAVVITDGESNDKGRTRRIVEQLQQMNVIVLGIGLGATHVEELYAPYGKYLPDPGDLPETLVQLLMEQLADNLSLARA